jgi:diguanylate cyclase (GGDEF)-like protein/PAS domain S-box-containing protein
VRTLLIGSLGELPLESLLVRRGHDVTACATADEASAAMEARPADLLILDWSDVEAGARLCRRLRAIREAGLIVAVPRAGADAAACLAAGADDVLERSADPQRLADRVVVLESRVAERARSEREQVVVRAMMEHFPGNIYFKDLQSRFIRTNRAFDRYVGLPQERIAGKTDADIFASEHADQAMADEQAILETGHPLLNVEERETWPDGHETWVSTSKVPLLDAAGRVVGTFGISLDITERKRAEAALRQSEERYALAVRGANDGIWDWDLQTGHIYYSPRWKAMLGWDEEGIGDKPSEWFDAVHPDDDARVRARIEDVLAGRQAHFEEEFRIRHRDGSFRWVLSRGFALRGPDGVPYRMAGAQTDVTDRRAYDPLTGLPNRSLFVEHLEAALGRARRRSGYLFAVLFLDVDRFKLINDSLGHLAGDVLLTSIGKRLAACLRPEDFVGRFGGDEFAILLDNVAGPEDGTRVAERILAAVREPIELHGSDTAVSASIGIAFSATGYEAAAELLRDADTAMYRAKALGRDRFEVFDEAMRRRVLGLLQLEGDLRRALERGELVVHYQPIVSLRDGRLLGFEALLRWRSAQRGLVMPEDFIDVAEDSGLIVPIGEWVLHEACRQLASWHARFPDRRPLALNVNCAARYLTRSDVAQRFERLVAASGLDPATLTLEITESALIEASEPLNRFFARLKELGVGLTLDDFGTGYSSLTYLHRFPVDTLKVDRSFVARLDDGSEEGRAFVRSIVALARSRRMGVIAEGVESREQVVQLQGLDVETAQGFYFAEALDAARAEDLLATDAPWRSAVAGG